MDDMSEYDEAAPVEEDVTEDYTAEEETYTEDSGYTDEYATGETFDLDADGVADDTITADGVTFVDSNDDGTADAIATDYDYDGVSDELIVDTDGDGVVDAVLTDENQDAFLDTVYTEATPEGDSFQSSTGQVI
jgi:hypothetical protein